MQKNIYYVYEWIRLDTNEPFYVGKGKGKGKRWHVLTRGNNGHFNNIVKSIPVAVNFLIKNVSEKEAYQYECYYIWLYRDIIGYEMCNINDGGEGSSFIGKDNPMYGKKPCEIMDKNTYKIWLEKLNKNRIGMAGKHHSKETKKLFSIQRKGRKLTEEWKQHIKESSKPWNLGKKSSDETKHKISINHADVSGANNPRATEVYIYDSDFNLVNKSDTVIEASQWLVDNGYLVTINNGRSIINKRNKDKKPYKGLYICKGNLGHAI